VKTDLNIQLANDLICSQEGQPETSNSLREMARETGISHSSVVKIAKNDLQLNVLLSRFFQKYVAVNFVFE